MGSKNKGTIFENEGKLEKLYSVDINMYNSTENKFSICDPRNVFLSMFSFLCAKTVLYHLSAAFPGEDQWRETLLAFSFLSADNDR